MSKLVMTLSDVREALIPHLAQHGMELTDEPIRLRPVEDGYELDVDFRFMAARSPVAVSAPVPAAPAVPAPPSPSIARPVSPESGRYIGTLRGPLELPPTEEEEEALGVQNVASAPTRMVKASDPNEFGDWTNELGGGLPRGAGAIPKF